MAAAKKAADAVAAAEVVAAEINDKIKDSKTFASAYKNQNSKSYKLYFYFNLNKIVRKSYRTNHKLKWNDKHSINIIDREYYFIYNDSNI